MGQESELIPISIDSSSPLHSSEHADALRERLVTGLEHQFLEPLSLFYSPEIDLRRERPHHSRPWFQIDREEFDGEQMVAHYDIRIFPPILKEERRRFRELRGARVRLGYPKDFELREGDYTEILGFYLRMRIIRQEVLEGRRREVWLPEELLSELSVEPSDDQLLKVLTEYYATNVLLPRFLQGDRPRP